MASAHGQIFVSWKWAQAILISHFYLTHFSGMPENFVLSKKGILRLTCSFFLYKSQWYKLQVNWLVVRCLKKRNANVHTPPRINQSMFYFMSVHKMQMYTLLPKVNQSVFYVFTKRKCTHFSPKAVNQCFMSVHSKVILDTPQNSPCHGS